MSTNLRAILTEDSTPDRQPLFRTGLEIGKLLASLPTVEVDGEIKKNPYLGRKDAAVAIVNQLMRRECSASAELLSGIIILLKKRLEGMPPEAVREWEVRVRTAIGQIGIQRKESTFYREVLEHGLLLSERARHFFLVYASLTPFAADLYTLREVMAFRLGLYASSGEPTARFSFYYADSANCEEVWRRMLLDMAGVEKFTDRFLPLAYDPDEDTIDFERGIELAADKFIKLEQDGYLSVFTIPEVLVSVPLVALDPLDKQPYLWVVCSDIDQSDVGIRVLQMPDTYTRRWVERVAQPLILQQVAGMRPQPFHEVREKLVKEAREYIKIRDMPDYSPEIAQWKRDRENAT